MKEHLIKRFGEHRVSEIPVKENEVPLLILDLELKSPVTVILTNGLRAYKMPVDEKWKGREYNELYFCLPSYWEWEDTDNTSMNWVFYWIQRLSKFVVENKTWFGHGHTMPCGKDLNPLSPTMKQNHFMLSDPLFLEEEMVPILLVDKEIHFLSIIPLFKDEFDYKQSRGTFKFMQKLANSSITEKLDDYRGSALKRSWRLKR
ncbi:suppressor of fused domain protein [Crocinitomicaceae bacterium]|nr:suppressor of fused domain protein [Crocinitomicaceae bacterium]MDB4324552.1 suppressor of fused domain protein [Crocinitomicaceae bacterium]